MKKIVMLLLGMMITSLTAHDGQPDLRYLFGPNAKVPYFVNFNTGSWGSGASVALNNAVNDGGQIVAQDEVIIANVYYNKEGWIKVGNKSLTGNWAVIGDVRFDVNGNVFREGSVVRGSLAGSIPDSKLFGLNLRNVDFGTIDVSRSDFSFSDLTNARLDKAQVDGADFSCAIGLTDQQKKNLKDRGTIIVEGQDCKNKLDQRIKEFIKKGGLLLSLKNIIKQGGDINVSDEEGLTLLMLAAGQASNGEVFAGYLLDNGADHTLKNKRGYTALEIAESNKNYEVVNVIEKYDLRSMKRLCNAEWDCLQRKLNDRLITLVVERYPMSIIEYYLKRGADINVRFGQYLITPLIQAILNGNNALVQMLINNNADIELGVGTNGNTPLMLAALNDNVDATKKLIAAGANCLARNKSGGVALDFTQNNSEIAQLITEAMQVQGDKE